MITPISQELLSAQFELAAFPFWLVNSRLEVLSVNSCARELYPSYCLTDGIKLCLSPADVAEVTTALASGAGVVRCPSVTSNPTAALSFSPWLSPEGEQGAFVILTSAAIARADSGGDYDLRRSLEGVGNLVVTQALRSCMGDIFTELAVITNKLRSAGVSEVDGQLRQINKSCYRVMRATGNLSEKILETSLVPQPVAAVNFWDCCAELFEAVGTLLRSASKSFSYRLPDTQVYVECSFERITTALLNIITNSYLHNDDDVQVTVTGRERDGRVYITIADSGAGLPDSIRQRLFQPYCSWDCLDQQNAGMGLGLHLVRNIITDAGGSVNLHSDSDGTSIALSLPTVDPPKTPPTLASSSAQYMQDRYSPLYFALCDVIELPEL